MSRSNRPRPLHPPAVLGGLAAAALLSCTLAPSAQAAGPPAPGRTTGPDLSLTVEDALPATLVRGETAYWQVSSHLAGIPAAQLSLRLVGEGVLVLRDPGLQVQVDGCSVRWTGGTTCPGEQQTLVPEARVRTEPGSGEVAVGTLTPTDSRWLMVSVTVPAEATLPAERIEGRLGLKLTAVGDWAETPPTPSPSPPPATPDRAGPPAATPDRAAPPAATPDRAAPVAGPRGPSALARTGLGALLPLALGAGTVMAGLALSGIARWLR